ncbi:hypothetical protein [Methylobacterium sp. P1-11]|uniref:hypothetical protein n=1 Tax=Methylobacterium sp. P1-11 TaxID=2024616 RepID=UPI0011EFBE29|nr:hypothetical protein [Methylobacterium sp. P1-11]
MVAYDDVGRAIGESGSWVRKFLGRHAVRLDADTYLAIRAAYDRECARIEAEAELERARFFALGGRLDAMASSEAKPRRMAASSTVTGAGTTSAVVASEMAEMVGEDRQ